METFLSKLLCRFAKAHSTRQALYRQGSFKLLQRCQKEIKRDIPRECISESQVLFDNTCESIIKIKVSIEILLMITIIMTLAKILHKRLQTYLASK